MVREINSEHPSSSRVQQEAERFLLEALENKLGLQLGSLKPKRIPLTNSFVEIDGYNDKNAIICEVYAHIGKLKSAQVYKPINDTMKMLLIEKITGRKFRKIFVVCDAEVEIQLSSTSWRSLALKEFGIEVIRVECKREVRVNIQLAQRRQYR